MACTASQRDLVYFTFGDLQLRDEFYEMYRFFNENNITISKC